MPLFEVAVIENADTMSDTPKPERLVAKPEYVMAKDGQAAAMNFVMDHATALSGVDRERMAVLVRPFA